MIYDQGLPLAWFRHGLIFLIFLILVYLDCYPDSRLVLGHFCQKSWFFFISGPTKNFCVPEIRFPGVQVQRKSQKFSGVTPMRTLIDIRFAHHNKTITLTTGFFKNPHFNPCKNVSLYRNTAILRCWNLIFLFWWPFFGLIFLIWGVFMDWFLGQNGLIFTWAASVWPLPLANLVSP